MSMERKRKEKRREGEKREGRKEERERKEGGEKTSAMIKAVIWSQYVFTEICQLKHVFH